MRQFFKFVFASCLGVLLAGIALFAIGSMIVGSIATAATAEKKADLKPNSVLVLKFDQVIPEKTNNLQMNPFEFENKKILGLQEMLDIIAHAKEDKNIKAVYLNLSSGGVGGQVTSRKLREAIEDFRTSGKQVLAYANNYSQSAYYLASAADKVYLNPIGAVDFHGYGVALAFFKEMLDNIGVDMQVFYAGQFKSATEPFRFNKMSDQNRLQIREYLEDMYGVFLDDISKSRNISTDSLRAISQGYLSRSAASSVSTGLADAIKYEDEIEAEFKTLIGLEEKDDLQRIGLSDYATTVKLNKDYKQKDKIAVVFAEGEINDGETTPGQINGDNYVRMLQKIRKDDQIKALVLRVNSGGGSVLASDRILREIELIKAKGVPVVTSMGDLAASGGYYIACKSDKIFAEPSTITGSIGVFGILPSMQKLFGDKLGIHFDTVRTNDYAVAFTPFYKLNPQEFDIMQKSVDQIYDRFLTTVSEGRNMSKEAVQEVAQGRIWTGKRALDLGLVDEIGGLQDALAYAAEKAGLEGYRTTEYPRTKEPLEQLLENLMGVKDESVKAHLIKSELGAYYPFYNHLVQLRELKGPQMRMPFILQYD